MLQRTKNYIESIIVYISTSKCTLQCQYHASSMISKQVHKNAILTLFDLSEVTVYFFSNKCIKLLTLFGIGFCQHRENDIHKAEGLTELYIIKVN